MIKISNLGCQYNRAYIFKGVDLEVDDGDYIAIIGENGSGKTSLIEMLLGVNKAYSGTIQIDGRDVSTYKDWEQFGYVPQNQLIKDDIPINVDEYLSLYTRDNTKKMENIKKFKLEKMIAQPLAELSGGERQKVNIAKALSKNIKYLILDEPNIGLDVGSREELYEILHQLNKEGLTIIIISHTIEEFQDKIHKIFNMETNKVEEVSKNDCQYC